MNTGVLGGEDVDEDAPQDDEEVDGELEHNMKDDGVEEQPPTLALARPRSSATPPTITQNDPRWPRGAAIKLPKDGFGTPSEPLCTAKAYQEAMVWALNPHRDHNIPFEEIYMDCTVAYCPGINQVRVTTQRNVFHAAYDPWRLHAPRRCTWHKKHPDDTLPPSAGNKHRGGE